MYQRLYDYARDHYVKRDIYDEATHPWRRSLTKSPRAAGPRDLKAPRQPRQGWC